MAKSVMISIRPEWVEMILNGDKTVEIRKNAPKLEPPFKCYIYCTHPRPGKSHQYDAFALNGKHVECGGKVVGEFVCDRVFPIRVFNNGTIQDWNWNNLKYSCVSYDDIVMYIGNNRNGCGWHISDLKVYDKPKELYEFYKCGAATPEELDEQLCNYCVRTDYGEHKSSSTPNGYWMCEGAWCDEAYREYLDTEYVLTRPPQSWCYVEEL